MVTRLFDGIEFCEQFLKRTYQGTFLQSLVQIGKQFGRCLKKLLATHDGRRTQHRSKARCA